MNQQNGNKGYLYGIVLVAVLGGLLFGYDTAVISGAEKGLQAYFLGASDFQYTDFIHGLTCSSALIGCVIGALISGWLANRLGRKHTLFVAGILFFVSALGSAHQLQLLSHHRWHGRWIGERDLPDVYWRDSTGRKTWSVGELEPVCHHFRPVGGLFRQFPHSGVT